MNQLIDKDDHVLYVCDIYKNMTEGGCEGLMCLFGKEMFGEICGHTQKRMFSKNYKDHFPTEEDILKDFDRMGNYLIEKEVEKI